MRWIKPAGIPLAPQLPLSWEYFLTNIQLRCAFLSSFFFFEHQTWGRGGMSSGGRGIEMAKSYFWLSASRRAKPQYTGMQGINVLAILLLDYMSTVNISSNLDLRRFGIYLVNQRKSNQKQQCSFSLFITNPTRHYVCVCKLLVVLLQNINYSHFYFVAVICNCTIEWLQGNQ